VAGVLAVIAVGVFAVAAAVVAGGAVVAGVAVVAVVVAGAAACAAAGGACAAVGGSDAVAVARVGSAGSSVAIVTSYRMIDRIDHTWAGRVRDMVYPCFSCGERGFG
jgi:hypothetical protein